MICLIIYLIGFICSLFIFIYASNKYNFGKILNVDKDKLTMIIFIAVIIWPLSWIYAYISSKLKDKNV